MAKIPPSEVEPSADPDNLPLEVEVKVDETPKPQPSLKEKVLGWVNEKTSSSQPKKPVTRARKTGPNLLTTAMPSVVAAFIATYSRDMVHDPYKPCAPSKDEVSAILAPLFDILGREVEITGKASQNTIDLINSLICAMMYGARAYMTYLEIKKDHAPDRDQTGSGDRQPPPLRFNRDHSGHTSSTENATSAESDVSRGIASSADGDTERGPTESEIISLMLRRDIEGRKRLGLLPGAV